MSPTEISPCATFVGDFFLDFSLSTPNIQNANRKHHKINGLILNISGKTWQNHLCITGKIGIETLDINIARLLTREALSYQDFSNQVQS
jgi:hypothetical protein